MNLWMNDERKTIARQYVHDIVRSFVTEREQEGLTSSAGIASQSLTSIYAPDIERLLEIACNSDNYATKHRELNPFYTNDYYDIDGHCVHSLNGTVTIIFNGVSIQQKEYAGRSPSGGAHAERLERRGVGVAPQLRGCQRQPACPPESK